MAGNKDWKVRETIYDYGDIQITAIEVDEATKNSLSTGGAKVPPLNPLNDGDCTIIGADVQRMYEEIVSKPEKDCFLRKTVKTARNNSDVIWAVLLTVVICATLIVGLIFLSY